MNQTHIKGRDWSGIFSGKLVIEPHGPKETLIEDSFGLKYYSADQIIDVEGDKRNILCPKCWARDPQGVQVCEICDETGCSACLAVYGGKTLCERCADGKEKD